MRYRVSENGCWVWTGASSPSATGTRYGNASWEGRTQLAHRLAYQFHIGPIPDGLTIDHLCRNTLCVNPAHLEAVTHRENMLRGNTIAARSASRTHCPQGHPYDDANTYRHARGDRQCRACARDRQRMKRSCKS